MVKLSELLNFDMVDELKTKEDLEDYYLASNVLGQVRQDKEDVLSNDDVKKDLGLED